LSRNRDRLGNPSPQNAAAPSQPQTQNHGFSFVVPTEFVELPSKGRFYSPEHPLYNKDTIEIKQMTAREEDMLTSRSLLKKGIALDRVLESVIVDKSINPITLLVGDRNALIIAMRVSGYGNIYETQISCPACSAKQKYQFDLNETEVFSGKSEVDNSIKEMDNGLFSTVLPKTSVDVVFRLLNGGDEKRVSEQIEASRKRNRDENLVTTQLRNLIVSVNGDQTAAAINYVVENIPSMDARHLRLAYKLTAPDLDMHHHFNCSSCDHEQELEVPLTADFFWPDRRI